jgi:hypothetical protein
VTMVAPQISTWSIESFLVSEVMGGSPDGAKESEKKRSADCNENGQTLPPGWPFVRREGLGPIRRKRSVIA